MTITDKIQPLYAEVISDQKLLSVLHSGNDFVIDAQNLTAERENLIHTFGYKLIEEGYELTGRNDLYQYYFVK